jgi:hypothetical protein
MGEKLQTIVAILIIIPGGGGGGLNLLKGHILLKDQDNSTYCFGYPIRERSNQNSIYVSEMGL